jgi:hypothetical protein
LGISKIRIEDEPVLGISPKKTRIKELAGSGYFQKSKQRTGKIPGISKHSKKQQFCFHERTDDFFLDFFQFFEFKIFCWVDLVAGVSENGKHRFCCFVNNLEISKHEFFTSFFSVPYLPLRFSIK